MDDPPAEDSADYLFPALIQCFSVIICGYAAGRINLISQTEAKGLNTFVGNFALPCLIFLSLAELNFEIVNWWFLLAVLIAKGVVFFGVILISLFIGKPRNYGRAGLLAIFCTQSNDFAIGYPIILAVYQKTHPEYAAYLYLMAPISLAILNPIAFVLMEIGKDRNLSHSNNYVQQKKHIRFLKLGLRILKGIGGNPIVFMTALGIIGNLIFKHSVPKFLSGILNVFGSAFSGTALFLLGLRMVGKVNKLKGAALLLPVVLIIVKLLVLPVILREIVSIMHCGYNTSETESLSTYGFLYGTFPTAPAVFVFANQYSIDIDLIAYCMVACTFISAPLMFISAKMTTITTDYAPELSEFGFDIAIVSLVASVWMLIFFTVTKKFNRLPHKVTFCLAISQLIMGIGVVMGTPEDSSLWFNIVRKSIKYFGIISCRMWTASLATVLVVLQMKGPCFVLTLFPWLCVGSWVIPLFLVMLIILVRGPKAIVADDTTVNTLAACVLLTSLCVSISSLILYARFRKRNARLRTASENLENFAESETTALVDDQETDKSEPLIGAINGINYGTLNKPSASTCCGGSADCENAGLPIAESSRNIDIEDLATHIEKNCMCPPNIEDQCSSNSPIPCPYITSVERAANTLGLSPPEQTTGHGGQLMRHTFLIVAYVLSMFLGLAYSTWSLVMEEVSGIYIELRFLDLTLNYGQSLILLAIFGIDPQEVILPAINFWRRIWYGADKLTLTPIEQLPFETKHVCEQFITHHLDKCRNAISKDSRWRIRIYKGVFRGSCLVRWLCDVGLAKDSAEAVIYGQHLLEGRLIAHINEAYHFHDSPLLYRFI